MNKFKLGLLGLFVLGGFIITKNALADMAPPEPECTQIDQKTGQPGCGYLSFSTSIDAGVYEDRFVFLEKLEGYDGPSVNYSVGVSAFTSERSRNPSEHFAVDKNYFQINGGLNRIFQTKTILAYPDNPHATETVESMIPKDPADFARYSYNFIVSKDDKNTYVDSSNLIDGLYSKYFGVAEKYVSTPNLSCTADTCSEDVTYTPQAIMGNYILVAPTKEVFNPFNANKPAPYTKPDDQTPTTTSQSQTPTPSRTPQNIVLPPNPSPGPAVPVAEHVSLWGRLWNAVKGFFRWLGSLFK